MKVILAVMLAVLLAGCYNSELPSLARTSESGSVPVAVAGEAPYYIDPICYEGVVYLIRGSSGGTHMGGISPKYNKDGKVEMCEISYVQVPEKARR